MASLAAGTAGCRSLTRAAYRHPQLLSVVLPLLPHLAGAAVDVTYNILGLAAHPEGHRWLTTFAGLALGYTVVTLLVTGWAAYFMTAPL